MSGDVSVPSCNVTYFCSILTKLECADRLVYVQESNETFPRWGPVFAREQTDGRTDGQDESKGRFWQLLCGRTQNGS